MLLKSLVIIGALSGIILGSVGTSVPLLFPQAFSPDVAIIKEVSFGSFSYLFMRVFICLTLTFK